MATKKATKAVPFKLPISIAIDKKGDLTIKGKLAIPKTLPLTADTLYAVRQLRLKTAKALEDLGTYESELREHLVNNINKKDAAGIMGRTVRATIVTKPVPFVEDEAKFTAAAKRKGNEDLVQLKPNLTAIKERWDAGKTVPGVGTFNTTSVSLNKL